MESAQTLKISIPEEFELYGSTEALKIDDVDYTSMFLEKTEKLLYLLVMKGI